jgi:hypothetical protein
MVARLTLALIIAGACIAQAQQTLFFGTIKTGGKLSQGRFEVVKDGTIKSIVLAPYGITPVTFQELTHKSNQLKFIWPAGQLAYQCHLVAQDAVAFVGKCTCGNEPEIDMTIREFSKQDAILQGDSLRASNKEIQIIDRALTLLNNGTNWNRADNRVCDNGSYPYKWSLFCALHQASIDIDTEYRHLRPAAQATRQAINEITGGKKYAHLLQDYNNEAQSYDAIAKALNRAREILMEKIKLGQ